MNEQIEELKRLAEAATPGPWSDDGWGCVAPTRSDLLNGGYFAAECSGPDKNANSLFVAAANPSAILDLIRQLEESQQEIARANAACEMANIAWDQSHEQLSAAQARIAKLEAQAVPAGWKLVPIEPTREMIKSGKQAFTPDAFNYATGAVMVFDAMLAAAPSPEGGAA